MKSMYVFMALFFVIASAPLASAALEASNTQLSQSTSDPSKFQLFTTLKNTGSTTEEGIFELAFFPTTFSFFGAQDSCDPRFPYNVNRFYSLKPGESASFTISATVPPGTYRAVLTHADRCCTNGVTTYSCNAKQPYGFESTIRVVTVGNPNANKDDQCNTDYEAGTYLKNKGTLNCAVPKCENPSTATSKAVCETVGECNSGAIQTQVCADGKTQANVRYCEAAMWKTTGDVCPTGTIPPEPGAVGSGGIGGLSYTTILVVVLLCGAAYFFLKKKGRG